MVVQVSQSDLVSVFRCCYLLQIEVNGVVIRQIYHWNKLPKLVNILLTFPFSLDVKW